MRTFKEFINESRQHMWKAHIDKNTGEFYLKHSKTQEIHTKRFPAGSKNGKEALDFASSLNKNVIKEEAPTNAVGNGHIAATNGDEPPKNGPLTRRKKIVESDWTDEDEIKELERKSKWHGERFGNPKIPNASLVKAGLYKYIS